MLRSLLAAAVVSAALAMPAMAQDVTLKIHHFLPPQAPVPKNFITPWAKKIEKESGGRIKCEIYPAMQLGGKPPALFDQARDGVVDIVWTLPGYTPGRFPKAEVFEMPFLPASAEATSQAAWEYYEHHLKDELKDVHVIAVHTHGPGLLHVKGKGVHRLEDMKGLKLRGPTRMINTLIERLGATPVGMPVPAVPEALSKGVIDGTVIPWEVTAPLKDDNSGMATAKWVGRVMDEGDKPGLEIARKHGNDIVTLDAAETARWKKASAPVIDGWIADMKEKGIDGAALYKEAKALVAKYAGK
jgi:TRAP-type C4-dicarboxylate transport system substrate-binding protein